MQFQEWVIVEDNLLTKDVVQWKIHISLKYNVREHYDPKWMFMKLKPMIDEQYTYEMQAQFPEWNIVQDSQPSN
jgi:hypothetical protein